MSKLAICNGFLLTVTQGEYAKGTILIEDGKITAVGGADLVVPEDFDTIDAGGLIVTPGFIDAHSHLALFGDPNTWATADGNEKTGPIQARLRGIDSFNPRDPAIPVVRSGGVTAVYTGPGSSNIIGGTGFSIKLKNTALASEMLIPGSEMMKMALGENPKRNYQNTPNGPATRMGNAAVLRDALAKAQNYLNKIEQARKDDKPEPDRDIGWEALIPVLQGTMKARIHAHRADDIMTAIRIAEEFNLTYCIEHCTEGYLIADALADKQIECVVGPLLMGHSKHELWEVSLQNPAILNKAGVKMAIMVDSSADTQYLRIQTGIAIREGLDRDEALRAITIVPAEIMGLADRIGSIEVGKDADLALFDGDPFSNLTNCIFTIIEGEVVYQLGSCDCGCDCGEHGHHHHH